MLYMRQGRSRDRPCQQDQSLRLAGAGHGTPWRPTCHSVSNPIRAITVSVAQILYELGVRNMRLMTNNPKEACWIAVLRPGGHRTGTPRD